MGTRDGLYDTWELFILLASAAVSAGVMFINDCDETFGYWEALHRMLFHREAFPPGGGLSTWEWDSSHALRSYTWLAVLVAPWAHLLWTLSRLCGLSVSDGKLLVFYGVRSLLGAGSALCLWILRRAMAPWLGGASSSSASGHNVVAYLWALSLGSFEASTALLPNTLSLQLVTLTWAAFAAGEAAPSTEERTNMTKLDGPTDQHDYYSPYCYIFERGTLSSTLVLLLAGILVLWAWPFALIALVPPVGLSLLRLLRRSDRGLRSLFVLAFVLGVMVLVTLLIERSWYGTWQVPLWATLKYNVLKGSSTLYGTESTMWYLKNLASTFNFLFPLSLLSGPILLWWSRNKSQNRSPRGEDNAETKMTWSRTWWSRSLGQSSLSPLLILWISLVLTLIVFSAQPHKEERFLTCIYPNVIVLAAVLLPTRYSYGRRAAILALASLSVWRLAGRLHYYGGPMRVFRALPHYITMEPEGEGGSEVNICMGENWYRFPSHWFMPPKSRVMWILNDSNNHRGMERATVDLVHGRPAWDIMIPPMLPQYPTPKAILNDRNEGDVTSQYGSWSQCHYYIDIEPSPSSSVPANVHLEPLLCDVILDQQRAPGWLRWFWYPSSVTKSALLPFCLFEVRQGRGGGWRRG